ncbi:TonB-dependent receptor [Croceiramulus getboli]|nr:TonB-dependent receptor [Flavobacteriaceae bacterium YJPT1-3]
MKPICIVPFLLWGSLLIAQNCNLSIEGTVQDFHDGDPLFNATIIWNDGEGATVTNFDGTFSITDLCPGKYTLFIQHPRCNDETFELDLQQSIERTFRLEHHTEELMEVTVSGEKYGDETQSGNEVKLSADQLESFSGGSLGDALSSLPGISSLNTGSTIVKPVIQGLHSSRIILINQGTRLEDQEWGVEHAPNIDLNSAGNVTVIKGAAALRYGGDAVGGVIVTDARIAPVKDTLYGKTILNARTNGRGTSLSSNLIRAWASGWYAKAQGTLKVLGDQEAPDYVLSNTGLREKNFSLGFGLNEFDYGFDVYYSLFDAEIGILRASHVGGVSDLVRAINSEAPNFQEDFTYDINAPKQNARHHLARLSVFKRFESAGKLSLDYSFQSNNRLEFDIRRGDDRDKPALDLLLTTHKINANFVADAVSTMKHFFGLSAGYQENFPDPDTGVRRLIPDYERWDFGAYASTEYAWNDRLALDAGIRYDFQRIDAQKFYQTSRWEERGYQEDFGDRVLETFDNQLLVNPVFDFNNFSATLGLRYQLKNDWILKSNFSWATRAPNPAELFSDGLHHSAAIIELGDLRLEQEQSFKWSAAFEGSQAALSWSVSPYLNKINNFILLQPIGVEQTTRGAFPVYEYSQVDALLAGVDISASYTISDLWKARSSLAYVYGQDQTLDRPLIDMPPANWTSSLHYQQSDWNNFRVSVTNQTVFEQNRFPDNDFTATIIEDGAQVERRVNVSQPPEAYSLFHLAASMTFAVTEKSMMEVGLGVDNVLNTEYRQYLNRQRYFVDDLGRNFSLQLKINY